MIDLVFGWMDEYLRDDALVEMFELTHSSNQNHEDRGRKFFRDR